MFELETAIDNWKMAFDRTDAFGSNDILELEEHLRELVIDFTEIGLSPREAFIVAADRLGHPSDLQQEFSKSTSLPHWQRRAVWMLTGYLGMTVASAVVSALGALSGLGLAVAGAESFVAGIVMICVMAFGWMAASALACYRLQNLDDSRFHLHSKLLAASGAALVLAPLVNYGARVMQLRMVDATWHGQTAVLLTIGSFAIHLVVVTFCIAAMLVLNKRITAATL